MTGMLKASQVRTKRALLARLDVQAAGGPHRLVGHDAHRVALDPPEAGDDVRREQRLRLEELGVVEDVLDHRVHAVRLVGAVGHEGVQLEVLVRDGEVRLLGEDRRPGEVVGRQVRQQLLDVFDGVLLVAGHVMGHAGGGVVGAGAAQLLEADVLTGDGLDDVRAGDEHVRGLVDHDREVGDRRGVHGSPRAGAHDQADLRDDTARVGVAAEDLTVGTEGGHALLDAGAAGVVDADDRAAGLQREVHHLDDLLAVDLAQRAAEDGEVLGEHGHRAAVHRAVPGDDAVAVGAVVVQAEVGGAVPGELVELHEGALVEQQLDPLTGRQLALDVLLFDGACGAGVRRLPDTALEIRELAGGGVDVDVGHVFGLGTHRMDPFGLIRRRHGMRSQKVS
ncbi:hypothetical protein GCM10022420_096880 [Streptomyces iranensis]|uniref:Uncharacterized protein n=1 Tax=Streptomyces iranensis TaxID=576784 RepID=A0ABS4MUY2_9ACTN|nr:hypothetical protein [Streptomyces iranensis]